MIDDVLDLRRAAEPGILSLGQYFLEKMSVLGLLRRGENQARIGRRILRFEIANRLEVPGVGDHFGELLQLLELIQFRFAFVSLKSLCSFVILPSADMER